MTALPERHRLPQGSLSATTAQLESIRLSLGKALVRTALVAALLVEVNALLVHQGSSAGAVALGTAPCVPRALLALALVC